MIEPPPPSTTEVYSIEESCSCVDEDAYYAYHTLCVERSRDNQSQSQWIKRFHQIASKRVPAGLLASLSARFPISKIETRKYYKQQADITARRIRLDELHNRHRRQFQPCVDCRRPSCEPAGRCTDFDGPHSVSLAVAHRITVVMCISLALNIVALLVKVIAMRISSSISVIASVLDSVLDIFSGIFLLILNTVVRRVSTKKYPIGTKRLQPLGVLIFSSIMASASLSVVQHCLASLYQHLRGTAEIVENSLTVVILMEVVVVVKFSMYMYCRTLARDDVICSTLIRDHRNDVLSNVAGLCGVVFALLLHVIWDDVIGIFITLYIIVNWSKAAYAQMRELSCKVAPHDIINQLTFVAMNHHPAVIGVEKVQAYSVGCGYHAEVDIVLPADMSLQLAHDIGESLQMFLEQQSELPIIRAYVHTDYETYHHSGEHR
ncbi:cation efflux pump [Perkinsela sp. CCAP 1560/4]|nr:cation efflux pump [Perkinsela sp. CCAP 1560/4]KNH06724.1 cation efflux pump [Perkinsela sp. CCAP 1560/4]|eukprot:KNH06526.1 cation efflux pump [Perkinsela sp. CCAP 1560/4]